MKSIPAHRAGQVVAHVIVDDADYDDLARHYWSLSRAGYVHRGVRVNGKAGSILLHRQLMGCTPGDGTEVDHHNGDVLDNRRANLSVTTRELNMQNRASHKDAASKYRGVALVGKDGKWLAEVCIDHERYALGSFHDEWEAAKVAAVARLLTMPHSLEPVEELSEMAPEIGATPGEWRHYLETHTPNWGTRKARTMPMPVLQAWRAARVT